MSEYSEGPRDQPWEVVNGTYLYIRNGKVSFSLIGTMQNGRDLAARLNELDALAAWSCAGCGARFAQSVPPGLLQGVTHCSKCVEVKVLAARIAELEAALTRIADHCDSPDWTHESWSDDGGIYLSCEGRGIVRAMA